MSHKPLIYRLNEILPWWLKDRGGTPTTKTKAYRVLWVITAIFDAAIDAAISGVDAAKPGYGTPTALPYIGRQRLLIRGQDETDAEYGDWLARWLDTHRLGGKAEGIALTLAHFARTHPKIKVVNRAGHMVTRDVDGTLTFENVAWDWDSKSHPIRSDVDAPYWSDEWIIVYDPPWDITGPTLPDIGATLEDAAAFGIGHLTPPVDTAAVIGQLSQFKGAHSHPRSIIWCYDASLFDPSTPATMPDGYWGKYHKVVNGVAVRSRSSDCRYWEPYLPAEPEDVGP